jgi:hypothetical protein
MAIVGTSKENPVMVICPACGENLLPQKAAVMLHCSFSYEAQVVAMFGKEAPAMNGVRAFLCQCGTIYSPMTDTAREEWERRHREQGKKLKELAQESDPKKG